MRIIKKNKQGISLIVLVITIIIMIILATAVVITLSNSGIIFKANEAVESTNLAQIKTQVDMIWGEEYIEFKLGNLTSEQFLNNVKQRVSKEIQNSDQYEIDITLTGVNVNGKIEWVDVLNIPISLIEEAGAFISEDEVFVDGMTYRLTLEGPGFSGTITSRAALYQTLNEDGSIVNIFVLAQIQDGKAITWNTYKECANQIDETGTALQVMGVNAYGQGSAVVIEEGYIIKKIEMMKPKLVYKNETGTYAEGILTIDGLSIDRQYLIECKSEEKKSYFNQWWIAGSWGIVGIEEPISLYVSGLDIIDGEAVIVHENTLNIVSDTLPITAIYDIGKNMCKIAYENGFMAAETIVNRQEYTINSGELLKTPDGDYIIPQMVEDVKIERIHVEDLGGDSATITHNVELHQTEPKCVEKIIIKKSAQGVLDKFPKLDMLKVLDVTDFGDVVRLPSTLLENNDLSIYVTKKAKQTLYGENTNVIGVK